MFSLLLKRLVTFLCMFLITVALAVPRPAAAYTILGGTGGGHGKTSSGFLIPVLALIPILVGMMSSASAGAPPPRLPLAPENDGLEDLEGLTAIASYAGGPGYTKAPIRAPQNVSRGYVGLSIGAGNNFHKWTDTFGDLAGVPGDTLGTSGTGVVGGILAGYEWHVGRFA